MTHAAQQLLLVPERLVVLVIALVARLALIAEVASTFSVTLTRTISLALAVTATVGAFLAGGSVVVGRATHLQPINAQPGVQIVVGVLLLEPPLLNQGLVIFGQGMALIFAADNFLAQRFLHLDKTDFAALIAAQISLFPSGVTAVVFSPRRSLHALQNQFKLILPIYPLCNQINNKYVIEV